MDINTTITFVVIVLAAAVLGAVVAWAVLRGRNKDHRADSLRRHFGPEYDHVLATYGDRSHAENELEHRLRRMRGFRIRSLDRNEQHRFAERWTAIQAQFVDNPVGALAEAERLARDVMIARKFEAGEFDQRAADLSVVHPRAAQEYRFAYQVGIKAQNNAASTEELRQAMVHYRVLLDEILEGAQLQPALQEAHA